jgi:hypothetical protein
MRLAPDHRREGSITVALLVDHSFDGVELADDLAHPLDLGAAFFLWMPRAAFPCHRATVRAIPRFVHNGVDI